jgi:hypothetical protein
MANVTWQWQDGGSGGPGHIQRAENPVASARRVLRAHLAACSTCAPDNWCPASDRLYAAYRRASESASKTAPAAVEESAERTLADRP